MTPTFHGAGYYDVPYLKRKPSKHFSFFPYGTTEVVTKRVYIKTQEEFDKYFGGKQK